MLKFKKDGKVVGVLKDSASEPEGEAFKLVEKEHIKKTVLPEEELEDDEIEEGEGENETV